MLHTDFKIQNDSFYDYAADSHCETTNGGWERA